jgi:GNAT superfamily N-acetyltransferase
MAELMKKGNYEVVRVLFEPLRDHLATESIIRGLSPAEVFVDDAREPKQAVTRLNHRVYLAGSPDNSAFNMELCKVVEGERGTDTIVTRSRMLITYHTPGWEPVIDAAFVDSSVHSGTRRYYSLDLRGRSWDMAPPDGFRLLPLSQELLSGGYRNLDRVVGEMLSERASVEDFLGGSFGFCMLHGDEAVSWCTSEYNLADRCEVGIKTMEPYRRRGLAFMTCRAVIGEALRRGVRGIGWHCWSRNTPSVALALKLGFKFVEEYSVRLLELALPRARAKDLISDVNL